MRKRNRRILIGVGVVLVLLCSIYAALLVRSTAQLRQAYAALKEEGCRTQAAGLIPPAVPDAENGIVFYESAASLLKGQAFGARTLLWHLERLADSLWSDTPDPNNAAELKHWLQQDVVLRALAAVEEGARCPMCRLKRNYDAGVPDRMPIVDDLRGLGRLLSGRARLEAEAGATDKAWSTAVTQLRLAKGLRSDPLGDSHLCCAGLVIRACRTIQDLCEIAPPQGEDYRNVESLLRHLDDGGSALRALDGERLLVGERLFGLPGNELYQTVRQRVFRANDRTPEIFTRLSFRILAFRPRLVAEHAVYLDLLRESARLCRNPYGREGSETRREVLALLRRPRLMTSEFTPPLDLLADIHYRRMAEVHITRAGLALLQYRRTQGTLPPMLEALGPEGLTDPYTGEPLLYRVAGAGFVVYSVGQDLKDNGGAPRQPKQTTDYDLVWRFPRPKSPEARYGK
jgi:hypothetical protein